MDMLGKETGPAKNTGTMILGSAPFEAENARLASFAETLQDVKSPEPRHELAPGIWLDYQPDAGVVVTAGPDPDQPGLRLRTEDAGTSPWFSFSYALPAAALREGRYLGQVIRSSSRGPARFRVCLRYFLEDGFRDSFSRDVVALTGGDMQEDLLFVPLDAELTAEARHADVLFFFEGRSFDATLHRAEAFLV